MREWLQALARSDLAQILRNIGEGIIVACAILLGLTFVHGRLLRSAISDDLMEVFIRFHEWIAFFTYVWVSLISFAQLVFLTLRSLIEYAYSKAE